MGVTLAVVLYVATYLSFVRILKYPRNWTHLSLAYPLEHAANNVLHCGILPPYSFLAFFWTEVASASSERASILLGCVPWPSAGVLDR